MTKTQTTTAKMTTNMTTENSQQNVFTRNDNNMTIKMTHTLFSHQFMSKFLRRGPCRPFRTHPENFAPPEGRRDRRASSGGSESFPHLEPRSGQGVTKGQGHINNIIKLLKTYLLNGFVWLICLIFLGMGINIWNNKAGMVSVCFGPIRSFGHAVFFECEQVTDSRSRDLPKYLSQSSRGIQADHRRCVGCASKLPSIFQSSRHPHASRHANILSHGPERSLLKSASKFTQKDPKG